MEREPTPARHGLDRGLVIQVKKRFIAISDERLARTRLALSDRQQTVLDALPALFHFNHPALPGYISHETPKGLDNFQLPNRAKLAIKRLSRSFNFYDPKHQEHDLQAIFIMGSVGSIAHSQRSDLDVWLCHRPGLTPDKIRLLVHKGERIARWAQTLGAEVHCFAMDAEAFRSGRTEQLDDESSGSSQHFLLLDEFYRTAIWLGGRIPLWWLVPPNREEDYSQFAEILLRQQFVREREVIDFGTSENIPAGEFVGAGIWHLYKGIDSPYKSVLKLLLLESYASRYPLVKPLSLEFKHLVYDGEQNLDQLDAYVRLYQQIERYLLERQEYKRLELARRAFYFKVGCPLTNRPDVLGWQWRLLRSLVHSWGWDEAHLQYLDNRDHWKAGQVKLEKHNLVHELITSYRFISNFANTVGAKNHIDQRELETLGHKLHAAFDRKAGKIELINPDISDDLSEPVLLIRHRPERPRSERWSVYAMPDGRARTSRSLLLKQSGHLAELLSWCLVNQVYAEGSEILLEADGASTAAAKQFLAAMGAYLDIPQKKPKHGDFLTSATLHKAALFINLMDAQQTSDVSLNSGSNDAFAYGREQRNLVLSLDLVYCNSWNEIICESFHDEPLPDFAQRLVQLCYAYGVKQCPTITTFSTRQTHSAIINGRVNEFLSDLRQAINTTLTPGRERELGFLFSTDRRVHCLNSSGRKSQYSSFNSNDTLLQTLQKPSYQKMSWHCDSRTLPASPLPLIFTNAEQPGIKVFFYLLTEQSARLFVLDELQNLTIIQLPFGRLRYLLQSMHQFIRRILTHQLGNPRAPDNHFGVYPVNFYHLSRKDRRWANCAPVSVDAELSHNRYFEVKAIAEPNREDGIGYRLICDHQELEGELDDQLQAAARFIMSRRNLGEYYPCYLSDIDLSLCRNQLCDGADLLLGHFLTAKVELELRINDIQRRLSS